MTAKEICRVCGCESLVVVCDRIRGDIPCDVLRCVDCGVAFLPGQYFDPKALAELYRDNYAYVPTLGGMVDTERDPYRRKVELIASHLIPESTSLLEVGTGAGYFLRAVKGRVRRLEGVELANGQREFCAATYGVPMHGRPIEELEFEEPFDIVCAFQVLEHVPDPIPFLRRMLEFVKPGGILYVDVPNNDEPLVSLYDIPEYRRFFYRRQHLFNHTPKSLEILLRRAGFSDIDIWSDLYASLSNHMHWGAVRKPQATLEDAFTFLPPTPYMGGREINRDLDAFFARIDREYREICARHGMGDNIAAIVRKPAS